MRRTRGERELPAFAQALRGWMEAKEISSTDLARVLGVSAMAISRWRNGIDMPASGNWPTLADALGVDQQTIARLVLGFDLSCFSPEVQRAAMQLERVPADRRPAVLAEINAMLDRLDVPEHKCGLAYSLGGVS